MIVKELHRAIGYEIDKTDSLDSVGFLPEEYDYWLYSAIIKKVKSKFSGSGVKREAFEQNQKRIDDLRTLVREVSISTTKDSGASIKPNVYKASLPSSSYWFTVGEEVDIVYKSSTTSTSSGNLVNGTWYKVENDSITHDSTTYEAGDYFKASVNNFSGDGTVYECTEKRQDITETTTDRYQYDLNNPYSEHNFHNYEAKPLRLFRNNEVHLLTDGTYHVPEYILTYVKSPQEPSIVTVASGDIVADVLYDVAEDSVTYNSTTYNPGETFLGVSGVATYTTTSGEVRKTVDLPEQTHNEIVKETANMMLENTENPRYQTHTIENIKSE